MGLEPILRVQIGLQAGSSGNFSMSWPYILGVAGIFMMVTMGAALVTEGCRKIKLQYYEFKMASGFGNESTPVTEVEPYIPFNINPTGMQPLLTTSYLLAFPSIMASIFGSRSWENLKDIFNPNTSRGGCPWDESDVVPINIDRVQGWRSIEAKPYDHVADKSEQSE